MAGSFLDASHETNQPLDQVVLANVHNLFAATPLFVYQPRASIAYQVRPHTAVHAGFGVFNDIIPQQIADSGLLNAPNDPSFTGGLAGQVGGVGMAPNVPDSAVDATVSANQSFQTIFRSGRAPCTDIQPGAPTCLLAASLNTFPTGTLKTPYYYQFNFGMEQQESSIAPGKRRMVLKRFWNDEKSPIRLRWRRRQQGPIFMGEEAADFNVCFIENLIIQRPAPCNLSSSQLVN